MPPEATAEDASLPITTGLEAGATTLLPGARTGLPGARLEQTRRALRRSPTRRRERLQNWAGGVAVAKAKTD